MPVKVLFPDPSRPEEFDIELYQVWDEPYLDGALIMSRKTAQSPQRKDETRIIVDDYEANPFFNNYVWFVAKHSGKEYWGFIPDYMPISDDLHTDDAIWVLDSPPDNGFSIKTEFEIFHTND